MNRYYRPRSGRKVFGVFAGLALKTGWDPAILRLAFVLVALFTGFFPGLMAYIIAWAVTDEESDSGSGAGSGSNSPGAS